MRILGDPLPEKRELELRIHAKLGLDISVVRRVGSLSLPDEIPHTAYLCKSNSLAMDVKLNYVVEWHESSKAKSLLADRERQCLIAATSAFHDG